MKLQKMLVIFVAIFFLTTSALESRAQTAFAGRVYEDMSRPERLAFVGEQARRIAREISGTEYEFTPAFEVDIQKAVTQYAQRIGHNTASRDLRSVLERGRVQARGREDVVCALDRRRDCCGGRRTVQCVCRETEAVALADSGAAGIAGCAFTGRAVGAQNV